MKNRKSNYFAATQWLIVSLLLICSTVGLQAQNSLPFYQERGMQELVYQLESKFTEQARTIFYRMIPETNCDQVKSSHLRYNLFLFHENLRICQKITGIKTTPRNNDYSNQTSPNSSNNNKFGKPLTPKASPREQEMKNRESTPAVQTKSNSIWNRPGNRKVKI